MFSQAHLAPRWLSGRAQPDSSPNKRGASPLCVLPPEMRPHAPGRSGETGETEESVETSDTATQGLLFHQILTTPSCLSPLRLPHRAHQGRLERA